MTVRLAEGDAVHEFVVVREFEDDTAEGGGVANR